MFVLLNIWRLWPLDIHGSACHICFHQKGILMNFTTVIMIIFFALPSLASVPKNQTREFMTISMPSYKLNVPQEGDWTIDRDDTTESVSLQKATKHPFTSSIMQVIKKTTDKKNKDLSKSKLAENLIRDEESKLHKEFVEKEFYELKEVKKGTTAIGGKKLYFMSYKAAKDEIRVDAVLYLYFPENYKKIEAFFAFFASEAYLKGPFKPDLAKIHPLITSFKASDHVVPRAATISDLLKAAGRNDISQVKNLLDEGLDVNGKNKNGWSALMIAASQGNIEMLKLLIEKGAAVDEKNAQGQTPLIFAAHWGHADVVRLLIQQGVNVNLQMNDGWTALIDSISMEHTEVAKILIKSGADMNVKGKNGWTALMAAAHNNNLEIVNLMVENEADVNARDNMNRTALDAAKMRGHQEIVNALLQPNVQE
jgi:hypothetical protein